MHSSSSNGDDDQLRWQAEDDQLLSSAEMISSYDQLRWSVETISSYDQLRWSVEDDDRDNGVQEQPSHHLSTGPYSGQPDYSCYNHHR